MRPQGKRHRAILAVLFVLGLGMSPAAYADDDVRGVITARGHDGMLIVRPDDDVNVIVVLDDATCVKRSDGPREKQISSASLIPGLRVHVEGVFLTTNQLAAQRVTFSRLDLMIVAQEQHALQQQELQIPANTTSKRQSENRRVVVTSNTTVKRVNR